MAKLIGTAGHVDHGKTTLVKALTGIDADRLPEEKSRGLTIDVGFAFIDLPGLGRVSIVDLPGHERFISNMLVGASGVDLALLCVSANEGVKPQTVEHFQILSLLPVQAMVVVLTQIDLAEPDDLELVKLQVEELLRDSRFKGVPVIPVSAITGEGLEALRATLTAELSKTQKDQVGTVWYLPIDRAFSVKGQGCVVTGTLAGSTLDQGAIGNLVPGRQEVRIRVMHSHAQKVEKAMPGMRLALNLSGVKVEDVERGMAICAQGAMHETDCFEAELDWVSTAKHAESVRIAIGTVDAMGKIFIDPNDENHVQIRLREPIAVVLGQPVIVRRHSPPTLLGGGRVTVPQSLIRSWRNASVQREQPLVDQIIQTLEGEPAGLSTSEICRRLGRTAQELGTPFEQAKGADRIAGFAGQWVSQVRLTAIEKELLAAAEALHSANPTRPWLARDEVTKQAGLEWTGKPLDRLFAYLQDSGTLEVQGTSVRLPNFLVQLSDRQRQFLERIKLEIEKEPIATPSVHELAQALRVPPPAVEEAMRLGALAGDLVLLDGGVAYTRHQIEQIKHRISDAFKESPFAASELRDALQSSRKYVIPLLEHLDKSGFTLRIGDRRVVRRSEPT